ncbi:MAG TPA: ornithine cyclodeaminase family protein [Terriglobales bacterium]|jgi:ornithine cyclodeaminase/alanine dehydrogenase
MMTSHPVLILSRSDVARLLMMPECIAAVEAAFRALGQGAALPSVLTVHSGDGGFHIKAGVLDSTRGYFAAKVNGNFPLNPDHFGLPTIQGVIVLCDAQNGRPLAVMDSTEITAMRTGAATAVAAKYLARPDSSVITICGCGQQGELQLEALMNVLKISKCYAFDQVTNRANQFAKKMGNKFGIEVEAAAVLSAASLQSDICVTCTTSRKPVLFSNNVKPGTFVSAVGADHPAKQEIDPKLLAMSKVVADILDQCAVMGDLHHAFEAGVLKRDDVHAELGEVVAGLKTGRASASEITIFDSTGMALQDVAACVVVYEKAMAEGRGQTVDLAA